MKQFFTLLFTILFIGASTTYLNAQGIYWYEGFNNYATGSNLNSSSSSPSITTPIPTWDQADSGQWCLYGVYRTTGSGCASPYGSGHLRNFKYASGGYITWAVSPVVNYGIAKVHFTPVATGSSGKHFVLEWTADTSALTNNWTIFFDSSKTVLGSCVDTTITLNQVSAKRIRFRIPVNQAAAGYQIEYDSVYFSSMNPIPVPVDFSAVSANFSNGIVKVSWSNANEAGITAYAVERSSDKKNFSTIGIVLATGTKNYNQVDMVPETGENYYRVRAINTNGSFIYSSIVKVNTDAGLQEGIVITPNPVTMGIMNLQLNNLVKGNYIVDILNINGQLVYSTAIFSYGGSSVQSIGLPAGISKGIYTVLVSNGASKFTSKIVVE